MSNSSGQSIDTTHLSIEHAMARGFIHRDYIAHCLRWSHASKMAIKLGKKKPIRVLDVGCGEDMPLARLLYTSKIRVETYVGIDVKLFGMHEVLVNRPEYRLHTSDLVCHKFYDNEMFDLITCFEVVEHVEPIHAFLMLNRMRSVLMKTGLMLLSTPCFDIVVEAANNHVNEMTREAVPRLLMLAGFDIQDCWGTFASQRDYEKELLNRFGGAGKKIFTELEKYYDTSLISVLFAPLFPRHSRNCIWQCKLHDDELLDESLFDAPAIVSSSSSLARWNALEKLIKKYQADLSLGMGLTEDQLNHESEPMRKLQRHG
ncbi:MAG TPA: methyltransferase domain-containing protein [Aquirhabdus sp.]